MMMARSQSIDGIRGIAVCAVLAFHAGYFPAGWLGVPVFFILSGYLLTGQLRKGVTVRQFWVNRAVRIMPLFYCYLAVNLALALAMGHQPSGYGWHLLGLSDQMIAHGAVNQHGHVWHLWSIAVEIQAYAILPLVARKSWLLIATAALSMGYWATSGQPMTLAGNAGFFAIGALLSARPAPVWSPPAWLSAVGRAGYSIYLWQMLCIAGAARAGFPSAAMPISLAVGFASYLLLERHARWTSPVQVYSPALSVKP